MKQIKFKLLFFAIINLTCKLSAFEFYEVRIVSTFQSDPDAKMVQMRLNYFFDKSDTASTFIKKLNDELQKKTPCDVVLDPVSYKQGLSAIQSRLRLFDKTLIYSAPTVQHLFSQPAPKLKQKGDLIMTYVEQVKKRSSLEFTR